MYVGGGGDDGVWGGGGVVAGERVFVVFSILERLRGGWLNIPLWCVSSVAGGVGRGRSVFTHTHTLLKLPVPFAFNLSKFIIAAHGLA